MPVEIILSKGFVAVIDEADFAKVMRYTWCYQMPGYAVTNMKCFDGSKLRLYLHRLILDAPHGMTVDHINGDGLDNRRSNLRLCTHGQNLRNQKANRGRRFKGAYRIGERGYFAKIAYEGKSQYLGVFPSELEAAQAYDNAAKLHHGEYARLNFPSV